MVSKISGAQSNLNLVIALGGGDFKGPIPF